LAANPEIPIAAMKHFSVIGSILLCVVVLLTGCDRKPSNEIAQSPSAPSKEIAKRIKPQRAPPKWSRFPAANS
jgi:hypothetical protein